MDERRRLLEGADDVKAAEADLARRLTTILDPPSLEFRRIDRSSPRAVLDKITAYEAVHPIRDARDLARRLADDRRCYALFHPTLPDEPLIFTELALTTALAANADALLNPESTSVEPDSARCAVLYSISSCHPGLKGVPLGNALLGRVATELDRTCPHLDTMATLSPVPGFRRWLARTLQTAFADLNRSGWLDDARSCASLVHSLVPLCAHYLLHVKRSGDPEDAVARFHLRNGARLERINWLSHTSVEGMRLSAGLMVNYLYKRRSPSHYDAWSNAGPNASHDVAGLALSGAMMAGSLTAATPAGGLI